MDSDAGWDKRKADWVKAKEETRHDTNDVKGKRRKRTVLAAHDRERYVSGIGPSEAAVLHTYPMSALLSEWWVASCREQD